MVPNILYFFIHVYAYGYVLKPLAQLLLRFSVDNNYNTLKDFKTSQLDFYFDYLTN